MRWPLNQTYEKRFFVPDLSPEQRPELKKLKARYIFVAESPHESEVESKDVHFRRPLCGRAGQAWWKMVAEIALGEKPKDLSLDLQALIGFCQKSRIVVMNAVQYPLDPKIMAKYGAAADPVERLGFSKVPPASFKKLRKGPHVPMAVERLQARLMHPSVAHLPVISLGNDSAWFINEAMKARHLCTIAHPSAWWRQGGKLRERAREQLTALFKDGHRDSKGLLLKPAEQ